MTNDAAFSLNILHGKPPIAVLLQEAGLRNDSIRTDRAFASRWVWSDGELVVTTIWVDEIDYPGGVPTWRMNRPSLTDLSRPRQASARERFDLLRNNSGALVRAIIQRKRKDASKFPTGVADSRGVDPNPWRVSFVDDVVILTRAQDPVELPPSVQLPSQWEIALAAVVASEGPASSSSIYRYIRERRPDYKRSNLHPDLSMLSVNSPSRTSYYPNKSPRRTDSGNKYDRLFKIGRGKSAFYEIYEPGVHGVWEISSEKDGRSATGLIVRRVADLMAESLQSALEAAEDAGAFDPIDLADARERVLASIVRRQGQPAFRQALLAAYENKCAMTGCNVGQILEAAHVHPYKGAHTNAVGNGLLLRADIHTLFDLKLIVVDSASMRISVSPVLADSEYAQIDGTFLRQPRDSAARASHAALDWHRSQASWFNEPEERE